MNELEIINTFISFFSFLVSLFTFFIFYKSYNFLFRDANFYLSSTSLITLNPIEIVFPNTEIVHYEKIGIITLLIQNNNIHPTNIIEAFLYPVPNKKIPRFFLRTKLNFFNPTFSDSKRINVSNNLEILKSIKTKENRIYHFKETKKIPIYLQPFESIYTSFKFANIENKEYFLYLKGKKLLKPVLIKFDTLNNSPS